MKWPAAIKSLFAPPDLPYPTDPEADARSQDALFAALNGMVSDQRAWITFDDARSLFSMAPPAYAFGDGDEKGRHDLTAFAARAHCRFAFMPAEGRIYFTRDGARSEP